MAKRRTTTVDAGRQARIAAMQREAARKERRRHMLTIAGLSVAALAVIAAIAVAAVMHKSSSGSTTTVGHAPKSAVGRIIPPPWNIPANALPGIEAAGLTAAPQETLFEHIHAHLDIIVNGKAVAVPPYIGFYIKNGSYQGLTALHTHRADGVIHIESPTNRPYWLGQVFQEWEIRLTNSCIGSLCSGGGNELRAYVNGKRYRGSFASIVLRRHEEIALVYGPASQNATIPGSYHFPSGE